jgi:hypothetical protein
MQRVASRPVAVGVLLANGSLARGFFWRALDASDYWLRQAGAWLADVLCGPESETDADQWRAGDPRS